MKQLEAAGHRVLVQSDPVETQTAAGIFLTNQAVVDENFANEIGTILHIGPTAFAAFGGLEAWGLEEGDKVLFSRYGGKKVEMDGHDTLKNGVLRILNDEDIVGIFREGGEA